MKYFLTKPPANGEFGPESVIDYTTISQTISYVHFVFDHWPDDLVTRYPEFLASRKLIDALVASKCTGFIAESCKVGKSVWFAEREIGNVRILPKFFRLIVGSNGENDLVVIDSKLIVSLKAKQVIESLSCENVRFFALDEIGTAMDRPKFKFPDK